ncbi:MAG: DUF5808 domain-containing protein [Bacteroidota bacterium]
MEDQWRKDPSKWIWGLFYFNRDDKRLFPPKKQPFMGWTVNFANPNSVIAFLAVVALILLLAFLVQKATHS